MFTGHYAAAFVAKGAAPRVPLWLLFLCVQLVDLAWVVLVLLGVERVELDPQLPSNPLVLVYMPYTHSLVATVVWSAAAGLGAYAFLPNSLGGARRRLAAWSIALAVASHWFTDLLVHRPDLAVFGEGWKLGLGLWNWPLASTALEIGLVLAATLWCAGRSTRAERPRILALGGFLALLELLLFTGAGGALPAGPTPLVATVLVTFLLLSALAWGALSGVPRESDLFHIAEPEALAAWKARGGGAYVAASFATEGFIHCSTREQLAATAQRHYAGRTDLHLLEIDSNRLRAYVSFEDATGRGERHPHVYGPIETDAVLAERPLLPLAAVKEKR